MSFLSLLALTATDTGGMRTWLLILVIVAALLILIGCVIALLTFYYQRKAQTASADTMRE